MARVWSGDFSSMSPKELYEFARAAVIKFHELGGLDNRNVLSHGSGGQKSEIKGLAGLAPFAGCEGESLPGLSPRLLVVCWPSVAFLGLWTHHLHLCLHLRRVFLLHVCLCVQDPHFIRTQSYWLRAHTNDLILT